MPYVYDTVFFSSRRRHTRCSCDWSSDVCSSDLGALLEMFGVAGLVYGIIEEPVHGWASAQVAGPIAGGALLILAFIGWQLRTKDPLVDLNLFRNRRFALSTVAFTIVGFAVTGVLFVLSPYLQVVQGDDAQGD